jgi:hypothetical protein
VAELPPHIASPVRFNPRPRPADDTVRIGCFGAIRPLKNQLLQAICSLRYAAEIGRKLEFHINGTRLEPPGGDGVVKNLVNLFKYAKRATLVQHAWMDHDSFLELVETMDMNMQCSFSETFNNVSADSVSMMVPVVASKEVAWLGLGLGIDG